MKYSEEDITLVRELPITEVADALGMTVVMERRQALTNCAWHTPDLNPSLLLGSPKRREMAHRCWCRSCRHGGDVIHLTRQVRKCSWLEAVDWLVEKFHNELPAIAQRLREGKEEPQVHIETGPRIYPSAECVRQFITMDNSLSQCLLHLFTKEVVERVTWDYQLGSDMGLSPWRHTLFPSIDRQGLLHQVKLQCYVTDPASPRFCHHLHDRNLCVGSRVAPPGEWTLDLQCLFGEHLLNRYPDRPVVLVESPKSAVVGACHDPSRLWLATGSKGMFNRQLLTPLLSRQVLVIPDRDAVTPWSQTLSALREFHDMKMSDFHTRHADWGDDHCDVADWIIKAPPRTSDTYSMGTFSALRLPP